MSGVLKASSEFSADCCCCAPPPCREAAGRRERRVADNADPPPANAHTQAALDARQVEQEAFAAGREAAARACVRAAATLPPGQRVAAVGTGSTNALLVEDRGCVQLAGGRGGGGGQAVGRFVWLLSTQRDAPADPRRFPANCAGPCRPPHLLPAPAAEWTRCTWSRATAWRASSRGQTARWSTTASPTCCRSTPGCPLCGRWARGRACAVGASCRRLAAVGWRPGGPANQICVAAPLQPPLIPPPRPHPLRRAIGGARTPSRTAHPAPSTCRLARLQGVWAWGWLAAAAVGVTAMCWASTPPHQAPAARPPLPPQLTPSTGIRMTGVTTEAASAQAKEETVRLGACPCLAAAAVLHRAAMQGIAQPGQLPRLQLAAEGQLRGSQAGALPCCAEWRCAAAPLTAPHPPAGVCARPGGGGAEGRPRQAAPRGAQPGGRLRRRRPAGPVPGHAHEPAAAGPGGGGAGVPGCLLGRQGSWAVEHAGHAACPPPALPPPTLWRLLPSQLPLLQARQAAGLRLEGLPSAEELEAQLDEATLGRVVGWVLGFFC